MTIERSDRQRRIRRTVSVLATVFAPLVLLAGCGSGQEGTGSDPSSTFTGPVPDFKGPYADLFAENYAAATSDFVRQVLQDGQITDAEYAEMTQRFSDCLADEGIEFGGFAADGGYKTSLAPNGGDTHEKINACSASAGEDRVGSLYTFIKTNPDNLDYAVIIPQCLADAGVVPAGYGPEDFAADSQGRFADLDGLDPALREALLDCSSDPLGLLGE